jgi:beta-galactosidase
MVRAIEAVLLSLFVIGAVAPRIDSATALRMRDRFDNNWRFYRGDEPQAWQPGFNDSSWRHVDLPHDWSIEDLPGDSATLPAVPVVPGSWHFKPGDDMAWKNPAFDDSGWQTVQLPAHWSDINYHSTNSYAWYRRHFDIPAADRGHDILLLIGKVDDVDETYVNGVKVGGMGAFPPNYSTAWTIARRYQVPAKILKGDGTDVIAIRDYNGDADAGIYEAAGPAVRSGPFDADSIGGTAQGYTVGGIGWYRKSFTLPTSDRGKSVDLMFDGVYMNSQIWLNGTLLGTHPYGYTSFHFDLTPHLHFGRTPNVLAVRVDASGRTSRWYSGSGIYRHAWLTVTNPVHVPQWGVYITTPEASAQAATVKVQTTLQNDRPGQQSITLETAIEDAAGKTITTNKASSVVKANASSDVSQQLTVNRPALWSPDSPSLYWLVNTVSVGRRAVDQVRTRFGIRTYAIDAKDGFVLNGKPIKLRGGCMHHDNGCLGSCAYDRAEERRVELLKTNGYNAIRTSHNPPSPAFLDACDRLGVLVIDEAFDCWAHGKNPDDYGRFFQDWWQRDLQSMVMRDRDHPSVVLWSIGNEIPEQNSPEGAQRAGMLADYVRSLDPSRPVTEATNPDADKLDPLLAHLDVVGYNYASGRYEQDHRRAPNRVFAATESFPSDCFNAWMAVVDHPYAIGDFVWTAMDYLGEAGLGKTVPQTIPPGYVDNRLWTVSNCGTFDLCGFKRPALYYRDAVWGVGPKVSCFVLALGPDGQPERVEGWGWMDERPSWTWPGRENKPVTVHVYSYCPQVKLTLNGKDLGVKDTNRNTRFMATWEIPYEPGELVATALDATGKEAGRWAMKTAGPPASIRLTPDRTAIGADGEDLSYVTVEVLDAAGVLHPNADNLVHFALTGPGKIIGVGNGDPRGVESFQQPQRTAYHGRCLVVIKGGTQAGSIRLTASADGLKAASTIVTAR